MKKKILVIAGPTGVGKTACSIALAKAFAAEIINGDAMQVYQGLDIGTAKIKAEEMEAIPHHMLDCYSIYDSYNVKIFQERGRAFIDEITHRGHLPILCGGTGLYIKSLLYDYTFQEEQRDEEFIAFLMKLSNEQLYALLQHVDKQALETIHPHNRQRMIRAIEMAHSGTKKSEVIAGQQHKLLYDAYFIGLTMEREQLYQRINLRVDKMMEAGLLAEVNRLVEKEPNIWNMQCFQSIGYKEWYAYYHEGATIDQCVEKIKKDSRNFAKRQYTWFHNQLPMHWYHVEEPNYKDQIRQDVAAWLKQNG